MSPRFFIPLAHYTEYTNEEVVDAIELFRQQGLIKQIMPVFPGETRFQIADDFLQDLIRLIWVINVIDVHLLIGRLLYGGKPTREDMKYLSLFIGKKGADKAPALTYAIRHRQKKENNKKEIEKNELFMQYLNDYSL